MTAFYLNSDIQEIVERLGESINVFSDKTLLLTGGRGFLGRYFIEVFNYLSEKVLDKPLKVIVLDNLIASGKEGAKFPNYKNISFINHNVINPFIYEQKIDYIVHAAGIASPYYYKKYPIEIGKNGIIITRRNFYGSQYDYNLRMSMELSYI